MTILYERLSKINSTNPYFPKDLQKAKTATKFIGVGSIASSTNKYALAAGDLANCGQYEASDIVFISAEGQRRGRIDVDFDEIGRAVDMGVTFITDDEYNRTRPYNIGERQVAFFLKQKGYRDVGGGIWKNK